MEAKHNNHQDHAAHEESSEAESHHSGNHMDVFDCIRTRRSVRKYKDKQVPWDNIVEILQAAKFAPFAGNVFNCKFVVIKNEDKRKAIAETCAQQYWMQDAPIHIVVVGEPEKSERYYGARGGRLYTVQGAAAAMQNMLLTAHSLGLGACWVGAFDEEEIRRLCNLPEHVNVQGILTIGYADEVPEMPPKYRIEHTMFFEKWWGRQEPPKYGLGMWSPVIKKGVVETKKMIKKAGSKIAGKFRKGEKKKKTKEQLEAEAEKREDDIYQEMYGEDERKGD
ncbi:MAG TPA: nitroreductase family protein [Candidatus Nanoarchaeia archaeon]|nr:nitroreductase family protein [Candidatus Nanoarchaeia archaeon]